MCCVSCTDLNEMSSAEALLVRVGHHLEWIALAPSRLRPARGCIERAARTLVRLLPEHSYMTAANTYPQFSHACRALALIEEVEPGALLARAPDRPIDVNREREYQ